MSTDETMQRHQSYGFTYVPYAVFNGRNAGNNYNANSITDNLIQTEFLKKQYFSFSVAGQITGTAPHACSIVVDATAIADYSTGGNVSLFAVIIENDVNYLTAYGVNAKNGKNNYNHVVRKFLTSTGGTVIGNQTAGKINTLKVSYVNDEKHQQYANLRVLVFVQDMSTKEILGAFQSDEHPFQTQTPVTSNVAIRKSVFEIKNRGSAGITISATEDSKISVAWYTMCGVLIDKVTTNYLYKGIHTVPVPQGIAGNGCYLLIVKSGQKKVSAKITITK